MTASIAAGGTSRHRLLAEVAAFVGFALLSRYLMGLYFWRYAGPASLLLTLAVLTIYLRSIGVGWSSLGLKPLPGRRAKLMVIPQAGLALIAFGAAVGLVGVAGPAIGLTFLQDIGTGPDDRWGDVARDWRFFLLWLAIVWTSAAFGEEMFFRGYLVSRLRTAFPDRWFGAVAAVVLPALLFGYGHFYYQGLRGAIMTCAIGLAFGTMFLLFKRNLWPIILLHGIIDTLAFTGLYFGWK